MYASSALSGQSFLRECFFQFGMGFMTADDPIREYDGRCLPPLHQPDVSLPHVQMGFNALWMYSDPPRRCSLCAYALGPKDSGTFEVCKDVGGGE